MKAARSLGCAILSLVAILSLSGCHKSFSSMPAHVSSQEMQVYEAWLKQQKLRFPLRTIEVAPLTSPIPPNTVGTNGSEDEVRGTRKWLQRDGVPTSAFNKLADLGGAMYPLPEPFDPRLAKNRSSSDSSCAPEDRDTDITHVTFSRIVFSRRGDLALLHVSRLPCLHGVCGGGRGEYLIGTQHGADWSFKSVGPSAILD